jgi:hypothetical protein
MTATLAPDLVDSSSPVLLPCLLNNDLSCRPCGRCTGLEVVEGSDRLRPAQLLARSPVFHTLE